MHETNRPVTNRDLPPAAPCDPLPQEEAEPLADCPSAGEETPAEPEKTLCEDGSTLFQTEKMPASDESTLFEAEKMPDEDEGALLTVEKLSAEDPGDPEKAVEDPALFADPMPSPDPDPGAACAESEAERLDALRGELSRLEKQLSLQKARFSLLGAECEEFAALYPDVSLSSLPDAIWEEVSAGIPLAAAYALAERKRARTEERARESNRKNRMRSAGELRPTGIAFFSPAEVRAMSQKEVRANYQSIMASMQKWS